jgi:hypothetical protein
LANLPVSAAWARSGEGTAIEMMARLTAELTIPRR